MKTIATVLLVLALFVSPVLGSTSGSGSGATTDGVDAISSSLSCADTPSSYVCAGSIASGGIYATTDAGSTAQDWTLDDGESSIATTSGSADEYSTSGAAGSAQNWLTGEASTGSSSEAYGGVANNADTDAGAGAGYDWTPPSGDILVVSADSGADAYGETTSADSNGWAETYWGAPTDYATSVSDAVSNGDVATSGAGSFANDADSDGNPDVISVSGADADSPLSGSSDSHAWSDSASVWHW